MRSSVYMCMSTSMRGTRSRFTCTHTKIWGLFTLCMLYAQVSHNLFQHDSIHVRITANSYDKSNEIISALNREKHPSQILKSPYYFKKAENCTKK